MIEARRFVQFQPEAVARAVEKPDMFAIAHLRRKPLVLEILLDAVVESDAVGSGARPRDGAALAFTHGFPELALSV